MKNITFDTYPDMFTDYENLIENERYDDEKRLFTVPAAWAINWVSKECSMDMKDFCSWFTWDITYQMYTDAVIDGVLVSEQIVERKPGE